VCGIHRASIDTPIDAPIDAPIDRYFYPTSPRASIVFRGSIARAIDVSRAPSLDRRRDRVEPRREVG
jgi:hypothetical protein